MAPSFGSIIIYFRLCFSINSVLPIFSVLPIGPSVCSAPSGEHGNCLSNSDCAYRGGIPAGTCGTGYGQCCVCMYLNTNYEESNSFLQREQFLLVLQTCGGIIRENSTYFVNPNHPDTYDGTGSCQVTVQKVHPDICQLRCY